MKRKKRFGMFFLTVLMMIAMAGMTFAEGTKGSITIKSTEQGRGYDLYRIFDLTHTNHDNDAFQVGTDSVVYSVNRLWERFFTGAGAKYIVESNSGDLTPIVRNNKVQYINVTKTNVETFSADVLKYALENKVQEERHVVSTADGDLKVENLAFGYYLVYPTDATEKTTYGCLSSLTSTVPDGEVVIKATYPDITKDEDDKSVELGQEVNYTINGVVPDTNGSAEYHYIIYDKMSEGLTFNKDVKVWIEGAEYITDQCAIDYTSEENGFKVTVPVINYQSYIGKTIEVTYSAAVNEKAVAKIEYNRAYLTYGRKPGKLVSTVPKEVEVYTAKIVIDKYDAADPNAKLAGAKFILKNSKGKYYHLANKKVTWAETDSNATAVTTDQNGAANFSGLEDGTYELIEIEAPKGYNLLGKALEITIDGSSATRTDVKSLTYTSRVANNSGTLLPSTGGMGTTILYIAGGILVLAAVVSMAAINKKNMTN